MPANLNTRLTLSALEDREVPAILVDLTGAGPQTEAPTRDIPAVQKDPGIIQIDKIGASPSDPVISKPTPGSFTKILLPSLLPLPVKLTPAFDVIQRLGAGFHGASPSDPIIKRDGASPADPALDVVGPGQDGVFLNKSGSEIGASPADPVLPSFGDFGGVYLG